jgi:hypothetical protein
MKEQGMNTNVCLGIIQEDAGAHSHYVAACRDLGVSYRVLDVSGPNWMDVICRSQCDAFLVTLSGEMRPWKQMYDERFRILTRELGKTLCPSYEAWWLHENMRRMHYWLEANQIAHSRTWIYYERQDAVAFADATPLPILFEAESGSKAMGIQVFRERSRLIRRIHQCFKKGTVKQSDHAQGSVLFREYIPNATQWCIIRIGRSYMGYQKTGQGDLASGSTQWKPECPPDAMLDFVKTVAEGGGFSDMALSLFDTSDRRYVVNQVQTSFGVPVEDGLSVKEARRGRFVYDDALQIWRFEEGLFDQNNLCNLRVETLLEQLNAVSTIQMSVTEGDGVDEV